MPERAARVVHEGHALNRDYLAMMVPLLAWPIFLYGWRPVALCAVALVTARICDWLGAKLLSHRYDPTENSSLLYAVLLVMLMPATVPYYVVVVSTAVAVLIAKEAFGGYGAHPFHPTAVGYVAAVISWPQYLLRYPTPFQGSLPLWGSMDKVLYSDGISQVMSTGGTPAVERLDLLLGNYAGAMGTGPALIILACGLLLLLRRRINVVVPACFLLASGLVVWCFPRIGGASGWLWQDVSLRLTALQFEMLSGGMLFGAVFLCCEPSTCPKNLLAQVIYGLLLGVLSVMYRYFGSYEVGVCFALLIMNAASSYIDRVVIRLANRKGVIRRGNVG